MQKINTDVLIIGSGAAGIRAALAASEAGNDVLMLTKEVVGESGSSFSPATRGWGIQALDDNERTERNLDAFHDEIIKVGLGRCDPKLVRILVEESTQRLDDLATYGIKFQQDDNGNPVRVKGCFSTYKRAFLTDSMENVKHSFAVMLRKARIRVMHGHAVDLITWGNTCLGAWVFTKNNQFTTVTAKSTILATGGAAGIFADNLVDHALVGDGYALAYRAGAKLENLEFIQFMLGMKHTSGYSFLPTAQLRVSGRILNAAGQDLLESAIPDIGARKEAIEHRLLHVPFSCRDRSYRVDVAVARENAKGEKAFWKASANEKPQRVVHLAHAFNGGVKIDERAETSVSGLFAAGETAAGPHGADRIGGCMMTATQVFGQRAGHFAANRTNQTNSIPDGIRIPNVIQILRHRTKTEYSFEHIIKEIKERFSNDLGILRTSAGLKDCLEYSETLLTEIDNRPAVNQKQVIQYLCLRSILTVGKLVAKASIKNDTSTGSHFRADAADSSRQDINNVRRKTDPDSKCSQLPPIRQYEIQQNEQS